MGNTILIAEDDRHTLPMLERIFRDAGYEPLTARTCRETIRKAAEHLPDCFVLDLHLEDGPVHEVCAFIRSHEQLRNAQVIIYSTHTDALEKCYESLRADIFVPKCHPPAELLAEVKWRLRRARLSASGKLPSDLTLDLENLCVLRYGKLLAALSLSQFRVLYYLFRNRPEFISGEDLAVHVLGDSSGESQGAIFSLIHRLRKKLGPRYSRRIVCNSKDGWAYVQPRLRACAGPDPEINPPTLLST
jgi:DNA-binding response OmpR family regulator